MEPSEIATLIFFSPLIAIWVSAGVYFCAVILRAAWDALDGGEC